MTRTGSELERRLVSDIRRQVLGRFDEQRLSNADAAMRLGVLPTTVEGLRSRTDWPTSLALRAAEVFEIPVRVGDR